MRVAVSGTHGVGKTTLTEDFVAAHPGYEIVPEPYLLLDRDGTPFLGGPTTADLEEQLRLSCELLIDSADAKDLVFDRSPLDFLAYLDVVSAAEGFEWVPQGRVLTRIEKALRALDLIAFVPIVQPDEIGIPIEYPKLRVRVDRRLKAMIGRDDLGLLTQGPPIVHVFGSRTERIDRLEAAVAGLAAG